jgi:hypothetical protein
VFGKEDPFTGLYEASFGMGGRPLCLSRPFQRGEGGFFLLYICYLLVEAIIPVYERRERA